MLVYMLPVHLFRQFYTLNLYVGGLRAVMGYHNTVMGSVPTRVVFVRMVLFSSKLNL